MHEVVYHSRVTDEESLAAHLAPEDRRSTGAYFTPRPIVERALDAVTPYVPASGPSLVVDPACGAGAFLVAAAERWPQARLLGVELSSASASVCRRRVGRARVIEGDALTSDVLEEALDESSFEVWLGNPPFHGTSPLLKDTTAWSRACRWLPSSLELRRGTSLREDYVFFLLKASLRLQGRAGALAFVTSSTLLDTFSHAPVREALLGRLQLREVIDLGAGAFRGTRVRTCITVWTTRRDEHPARFSERTFVPQGPTWDLVPPDLDALELDRVWRAQGAVPVGALVPVSFAGLKTRFDELLVDDDAGRLAERVEAFLGTPPAELPEFARRFGLEERLLDKLLTLKRAAPSVPFDASAIRPFWRYRGARPMGPPASCYVDRRLIPRGDHRQRGDFDPHAHPVKLVFNQHELPLAARVLEEPGCVTAYRHARFAPLEVPQPLLERPGLVKVRGSPRQVPNLSPLGRAWAAHLGSPRALFHHVADHLMGRPFQETWAPAMGRAWPPLVAPPPGFTDHAISGEASEPSPELERGRRS